MIITRVNYRNETSKIFKGIKKIFYIYDKGISQNKQELLSDFDELQKKQKQSVL